MTPIKREVIPAAFQVAIQPSPFADNPREKCLVIGLPLEMEQWVLVLNDEQLAMLHDSTAPSSLILTER